MKCIYIRLVYLLIKYQSETILNISVQSKMAKCNGPEQENVDPGPVKRYEFESAHESMVENPFESFYKRAPMQACRTDIHACTCQVRSTRGKNERL